MKEKDNTSNQLVVQSNSLIEAQYKLPTMSQKIIRKIISMIRPTDSTFEKYYYRLSVQDMANLLRIDIDTKLCGSFYAYVKNAVAALQTTMVSIPQHTGNEKSWLRSTWLASAAYNADGGYYEFEFSSRLESELLHLTRYFTQYYLDEISGLSSQYSIRIYELLSQIRNQVKKERIIGLDDLKAILGIKPTQYVLYSNFRIKVLEVSKAELTAKTNIPFEYEPIKTGRKVTAIKLIVLPNEKPESPEQPGTPAEQAILEKIPPPIRTAAKKALKKRGVEATQEIITYSEAQIKKGKVKDVDAYVASCLSNGYGAKTQAERVADQEREAKIAELRREAARLEKASEAEAQQIRNATARCNALLAALTPDQDAELSRLAEQEILKSTNFEKKRYRVQKKTGETTMIENYKRGMIEEFTAGLETENHSGVRVSPERG